MFSISSLTCVLLLHLITRAIAVFDMSSNQNLAVYWGQNSYGAVNSADTAHWQQTISYYCNVGPIPILYWKINLNSLSQDNVINTFPVAFLDEFYSTGNLPSINLANARTNLPNCSFLASSIETCQAAGKIVTISLGGATGSNGFANDTQAAAYAQTIWDLFLGGSSTTRPFGIDMDIEGGSQTGFVSFLSALRNLMNGGSKPYYITAAPQCPYPDAYIGATLNSFGFDAVYVQFYNNYCGLTNYNNPNAWDFGTWDNWAKTVSPNPNVKVYIGAPASSSAAGSGYVSPSTFTTIIQQTMAQYSSFGGVMLWDASQAYGKAVMHCFYALVTYFAPSANSRYDISVKNALTGGTAPPPTTTTTATSTTTTSTTTTTTTTTTSTTSTSKTSTTSTSTTSSPSPTTTSGTVSCAGVAAWQTGVAYVGGNEVTYSGDLWTAKWWSENDVPGGAAGDWTYDGVCA
ncbi:glycoside hydrolase family 18 protein [Suillus clintonianus]|uniref:glycoside hydrolase family 18 protein n=1 Tax=Suillus clintonianus TaxID=1904413 RepID=UPI001B87CDAD|nr:glycoside hydrolase family 18 protein [Suillus clintonianus]KAG2119375.1 glycoside hydrolase family 18 protein [Suillus clintonianus]